MKEGLVRYHYHVRRDTWNDRLEPKGQAETLRQKERVWTTLWRTMEEIVPKKKLTCHTREDR